MLFEKYIEKQYATTVVKCMDLVNFAYDDELEKVFQKFLQETNDEEEAGFRTLQFEHQRNCLVSVEDNPIMIPTTIEGFVFICQEIIHEIRKTPSDRIVLYQFGKALTKLLVTMLYDEFLCLAGENNSPIYEMEFTPFGYDDLYEYLVHRSTDKTMSEVQFNNALAIVMKRFNDALNMMQLLIDGNVIFDMTNLESEHIVFLLGESLSLGISHTVYSMTQATTLSVYKKVAVTRDNDIQFDGSHYILRHVNGENPDLAIALINKCDAERYIDHKTCVIIPNVKNPNDIRMMLAYIINNTTIDMVVFN